MKAFLGFFFLFFVFTSSGADIHLSATRTNGGIILSWDSESNKIYRVLTSTNLTRWEMRHEILAMSSRALITLPRDREREFFLVRFDPVYGTILLTNGPAISNTVTFGVESSASGANVRSVELLDITGNLTNALAWTNGVSLGAVQFALDTSRLRNGTNMLQVRVADDYDGTTSGNVRVGYSLPVTVVVRNPIALNGTDDTVERKFWLSFSAYAPTGTWTVAATNSAETWGMTWSGTIAGSTNAKGEIVIEDPTTTNGYTGTSIVTRITVTESPQEICTLVRTQTVIYIQDTPGCIVAEEFGIYGGGFRTNLDATLTAAFGTLSRWMGHFNLETLEWEDEFPLDWNVLGDASWESLDNALRGEYDPPTHAFFVTHGSPGELGNPGRLTPESLGGMQLTARLRFAIFAGHNAQWQLLYSLVDTRERSREEAIAGGREARFGLSFVGVPWDYGAPDLGEDIEEYIEIFLENAVPEGLEDPKTFRQAMQIARLKRDGTPNPVSRYSVCVGCPDSYFWGFDINDGP